MGNSSSSTLKKTDPVAKIEEIKEGERKVVIVEKEQILLTNIDGEYHAISATCPHLDMSLAKGKIKKTDDGSPYIVCSWHGAEFHLKDGKCKQWCKGMASNLGSKQTDTKSFKTRVDGGCIYLDW